jgi:ferredoxin-nitrite reductase
MGPEFSPEQKRFLEGFTSGVQVARAAARGFTFPSFPPPAASAVPPSGPDAAHLAAMARAEAEGKKLVDQEKWKRAEHPFDAYARLKQQARSGTYPKPDDNFRWRFHGLFYVAPTQDSYMCRLRIPNGILTAWQMAGIADIAGTLGGGYAHVTTRANLQIREIKAADAPAVVERLYSLGIAPKGAGADNIRNVTGSATAGIDPTELIDTRPEAHDWHHHVLNDRSLSGLPRKFNVAFDGGAMLPTLEETNDIGFQAVEVLAGSGVEPGVWYRLRLGGITGHKDLARDTGIIVAPAETSAVADAVVRVYIDAGNRTDRTKARLKYLLDRWGFDKFLAAMEDKLGRKLARIDAAFVKPRPAHDRLSHIGVHSQKQAGLNWIGVWTPLGRMSVAQMRVLADIARDCGDGDIRLTVWQNLLISGVADARVAEAEQRIAAAGLSTHVSNVRAGLVACTGNRGCKFASSDTKGHALDIAEHLDAHITVDQPVNIHLTGCHHSCAQHYVGDIGLLGTKVTVNADGDQVEGYHIYAGGGFGAQASIGSQVYADITARDVPRTVEGLLRAYMAHRAAPDESFHQFTNRLDVEELKRLAQETLA